MVTGIVIVLALALAVVFYQWKKKADTRGLRDPNKP
jgi:hypothetical protein